MWRFEPSRPPACLAPPQSLPGDRAGGPCPSGAVQAWGSKGFSLLLPSRCKTPCSLRGESGMRGSWLSLAQESCIEGLLGSSWRGDGRRPSGGRSLESIRACFAVFSRLRSSLCSFSGSILEVPTGLVSFAVQLGLGAKGTFNPGRGPAPSCRREIADPAHSQPPFGFS